MTSLAVSAQAATAVTAIPTPACIQPRRVPVAVAADLGSDVLPGGAAVEGRPAEAGPCRGTARQLLEAALAGVRLGGRDRQFLARLVHWDKRNAAAVASLLERAQEAGREAARAEAGRAEAGRAEAERAEAERAGAGLTPRQLELVVAALGDAAVYRASGAASTSCWDCEMVPGGRCADHTRDFDRASAYADLASALSAPRPAAALDCPRDLTTYRHRAPVAS
jgi:hypothetical protein